MRGLHDSAYLDSNGVGARAHDRDDAVYGHGLDLCQPYGPRLSVLVYCAAAQCAVPLAVQGYTSSVALHTLHCCRFNTDLLPILFPATPR
jgi:hypothetical protein